MDDSPVDALWTAKSAPTINVQTVATTDVQLELIEGVVVEGRVIASDGDVAYMSPERTHGGAEVVDCRPDLYSLGATVYALLTGRPPFVGSTFPETIRKIQDEGPIRPKKYQLAVPELFEGAVLKMLAKHPNERFQNARACLTELERVAKFTGMDI